MCIRDSFNWGLSIGTSVKLSFWMRTNFASTTAIPICLRNESGTYSYNTYVNTIGANSWQYVAITIPPPTSGSTWNTTNGAGILLTLAAWAGTPTLAAGNGTSGWQPGNFVGMSSANAYNPYSVANMYVEFTGVQLEKGTIATPFEFRPFAVELQLCQRYFYQFTATASSQSFGTSFMNFSQTNIFGSISLPVIMRAVPAFSQSGWYVSYFNTTYPSEFVSSVSPHPSSTNSTFYMTITSTQNVSNKPLNSYVVLTANNVGSFVAFSAEL